MIRETSIEAYNKIKENGLLSLRRWQVYDFVFNNGPVTARQISKALVRTGENPGSFNTRLSELRNMGILSEVGKILDLETKMTVIQWDVTKNLPIKLEKTSPNKITQEKYNVLKVYAEMLKENYLITIGTMEYCYVREAYIKISDIDMANSAIKLYETAIEKLENK